MKKLKGKVIWLLPSIIVLFGITLLFMENYNEVTEPANEEWSRELEVGLTSVLRTPTTHLLDEKRSITYITEDGVQRNIYDDRYNLLNKEVYNIPVDKFTEFYFDNNRLIFANYHNIYDEKSGEKITEIDQFFPLKNQILYTKDQEIYILDTDQFESTPLLGLDDNTSLQVQQSGNGTYLLTHKVDENGNQMKYYEFTEGEVNKLGESEFSILGTEEVRDIQFTFQNDSYHLLLTTVQKQSMSGKASNYYYYAETPFGEDPDLKKMSFQDPVGNAELREVSDLIMKSDKNSTTLLFKAIGSTETRFNEPDQFNIYKSLIDKEGTQQITRMSNTPDISHHPTWIDGETIAWVDNGGDANKILISSMDPSIIEKADRVKQSSLIHALGKTMGMLSFSFLALIITMFWFIWPFLFLVVLMFSSNRAMEEDHSWVLYTGITIYMLAALIVRDPIFSDRLLAAAPQYLSFPGSPFLFIIGFALLAFAILKSGARIRDWSISIQLTYFIGIHVLLVTIFFGPYIM
ncbi:hypothetical protein [Halobacillus litoralis]|uniref:hypothetical protein n=1 Tax=Halobacillus litoralis TaxID=45668 RepID=UPI00248F5F9D|nr:hypothetical protein [Halobacillus litoralis]